jgi:magnesium chelatase family protein
MSLAVVHSRSLDGLHAPPVHVEVQLVGGLPSFLLVGLADTEVKEARERVRAALQQSGLPYPHNQRITANLAPADVPKDSGRFDLPIALGILAAAGELCPNKLARCEFAGELSLAGELRPVRGALALALALAADDTAANRRCLVLPSASAAEAARVPGLDVRRADTLAEVVHALRPAADAPELRRAEGSQAWAPQSADDPTADLADVRGQAQAKRALELAAAGGHSLLLIGPPGSGKSMLAARLPGLLPAMALSEALQSAALQGLAAPASVAVPVFGRRPFRAPHHTASAPALVGGGSPPRPGEISLAHGGVLFLDEWPHFTRPALQALREPLETGQITLSRAARQASFPARFQLVAAMNPCPCGRHGAPAGRGAPECRCTPEAVERYRGRVAGPLMDRIDIACEVPSVAPGELLAGAAAAPAERSASVRERVAAAQARQQARQGCLNAWLSAAQMDEHIALEPAAQRFLQEAAVRLHWSGRRLHRSLKLARTAADLAGAPAVGTAQVAEALMWQRAAVW